MQGSSSTTQAREECPYDAPPTQQQREAAAACDQDVAVVLQYCLTLSTWKLERLFFESRVAQRQRWINHVRDTAGTVHNGLQPVHQREELEAVLLKVLHHALQRCALPADHPCGVCWEPVSAEYTHGTVNDKSRDEVFVWSGKRYATHGTRSAHLSTALLSLAPTTDDMRLLLAVCDVLKYPANNEITEGAPAVLGWTLLTGLLSKDTHYTSGQPPSPRTRQRMHEADLAEEARLLALDEH
jgi:hypothetical protein